MALETLDVVFKATTEGVEAARTSIGSVATAATGASVALEGTNENVTKASGKAGELLTSLKNMAKVFVATVVVKQVGQFAVDATNLAGEAEAINSTFNTMFSQTGARMRVQGYIDAMHDQFKLNETNMQSSANGFYSIWSTYEPEKNAENVVHAMQLAMDYAAMYDMSVAEASEHFKGLMVGLNATHDSAFGMTITKEIVEEWAGENGIEGKYEDMVLAYLQDNADRIGINGQYEREYSFYATQKQVLQEQIKELKENVGAYLLEAANVGTTALNGFLTVINNFFAELSKSSFTKKMQDAFGTAEFTKEELDNIKENVFGPMNDIANGMAAATRNVDDAVRSFDASYKAMMHTMLLLYTGEYTGEDADLLEYAEAMTNGMFTAVEEGRTSMIAQTMTWIGDSSEYAEAATGAIDAINTYYDAIIENVKAKAAEVNEAARLFMENMTPENKANFLKVAQEAAELTYSSAYLNLQAERQMYLDNAIRGGALSTQSVEEIIDGMFEASSASEASVDDAWKDYEKKMYVVALANGDDPEEYLAAPRAQYEATKLNMRLDALSMLAKTMYEPAYLATMETIDKTIGGASGNYGAQALLNEISPVIDTFGYLYDEIGKIDIKSRTPEMKAFYNMFKPVAGMNKAFSMEGAVDLLDYMGLGGNTYNDYTMGGSYIAEMFKRDFERNAAGVYALAGTGAPYYGSPLLDVIQGSSFGTVGNIQIADTDSAVPEILSYTRSIATGIEGLKNANHITVLNIDGVEVARAIESAMDERGEVTGKDGGF